jgi:hypothetical protein
VVQPAVVAEGEGVAAVDDVAANPGLRLGFPEVVCLNVEVIDNGGTRARRSTTRSRHLERLRYDIDTVLQLQLQSWSDEAWEPAPGMFMSIPRTVQQPQAAVAPF